MSGCNVIKVNKPVNFYNIALRDHRTVDAIALEIAKAIRRACHVTTRNMSSVNVELLAATTQRMTRQLDEACQRNNVDQASTILHHDQ